MAYTVHNFEQGDVLYAEQLNEMDAQIAANEESIENSISSDMLASDYSANKTYSIGDYVIYNNELYTCIYEITAPEGWNSAHWRTANLGDGIGDLTRQISDIEENQIPELKSALSDYVDASYVTDNVNLTLSGATVTKETDDTVKIYGTATSVRNFGYLNGNNFAKTSSAAFEKTLDAGTYLIESDIAGTETRYVIRGTYTTFASYFDIVTHNQKTRIITFPHEVMIAFATVSNRNYGTIDNPDVPPTYLSVSIKKITAKDDIAREAAEKVKDAVLYTAQELTDEQTEQARKNIDSVSNDTLYQYNFYDAIALYNAQSVPSFRGVSYTKNSDGSWTIDGTATRGDSFLNIIGTSNNLPRFIIPGRKYKLSLNGGTVPVRLYLYNGNESSNQTYTSDAEVIIPENTTGIILRFQIDEGTTINSETVKYTFIPETVTSIDNYYTYNTTVNKTEQIYNNTFNQTVSPSITTDTNGWLQAVDTNTSSETGKTDMTPAIMAMLNSTGYCHLGEGVFYVSGNIDMPDGSTLCGCGRKSVIRLLSSVSSGYAVKMEKYCTIKDISVVGSYSSPDLSSEGTRIGILFSANHDGNDGETAYDSELCMIDNVWINNFTGSGLKCHNTSNNIRKGLYATNMRIASCYKGINIDYYSEFNKFTNICTSVCVYGIVNNGGNNVFTACTIHATQIGFYVDGTQPNSAHGTITGCTFCHTGSNNGVAFKGESISAGFIIADCQIWYNSIELTNCQGVLFDGCMFGKGIDADGNVSASVTIDGGNLILFSGCMFQMDIQRPPKFRMTNNTKIVLSGCYGTESGLRYEIFEGQLRTL